MTIAGDEIKTSSGGLVAALEGLPHERYQLLWLGWPGSEIPESERHRNLCQRLQDEMRCIPPIVEVTDVHVNKGAGTT